MARQRLRPGYTFYKDGVKESVPFSSARSWISGMASVGTCMSKYMTLAPCIGLPSQHLGHCRGGLIECNLLLEHIFLSIVPSLLFISLASIRIWALSSRPRRIGGRALQLTKLATIAVYGLLQFVLLILWTSSSGPQNGLSVAAAVLSLVDVVSVGRLSYSEHTKNLRPSTLLSLYLFFSLLFDAIQTGTLWQVSYRLPIAQLSLASLVVKIALLLLEAKTKLFYLEPDDEKRSPEETESVFSLAVFYWVNGLLREGYRKILVTDDLYPLDEKLSSRNLCRNFWTAWTTGESDIS